MVTMINIHTIPNTLFSAKTPIPLHSSKYLLVIPSISMMWNPSITVRSSPRSSGPHRTNRVPCKVLQCKAAGMSWPLKRPPLKGHKFSENPMEWQLVMFYGLLFWWKGWCLMISWWCFRLSKPSNINIHSIRCFFSLLPFLSTPKAILFYALSNFPMAAYGGPLFNNGVTRGPCVCRVTDRGPVVTRRQLLKIIIWMFGQALSGCL